MPVSRASRRFLASLFLIGWVTGAPAQELPFTHFTPDHNPEILTSASVQTIYQDRLSFVWLGFYSSGLARYDGASIESYSTVDGLPDQTIREVMEDRTGRLWVGCDTGLVVSERPLADYQTGQRVRFVSRIAETEILQTRIRRLNLVNDNFGWLWAGTTGDGLIGYRFEASGRMRVARVSTAPSEGQPEEMVSALTSLSNGQFLAALNTGRVLVFESTEQGLELRETLTAGEQLPQATTVILYESSDGVLWGGTSAGAIWRMAPETGRAEIVNQNLSSLVVSIIEGSDGMLWIGSLGSGVIRLDPGDPSGARHITRDNGLLGETLWKIAIDHEGNLWFGQNGGLSRLRANYRAFTNYTEISLPDAGAFAVLPDVDSGWIWLGTGGGITIIRNGHETRTISSDDGLSDNSVYAITKDGAGRIWLGTVGGIDVISPRGTSVPGGSLAVRELSLFDQSVTSSSYDFTVAYAAHRLDLRPSDDDAGRLESIWVAGNSGISAFVGDRRVDFGIASGLPGTGATNVALDDADFLWVGTSDAGILRSREPITQQVLNRILAGRSRAAADSTIFDPVWNKSTGAPTNGVRNLRWVDGRLWIGTSAGLVVAENDPFRVETIFDARNGLGGDVIVGTVVSREDGLLWVSQNDGLAAVDIGSRTVVKRVDKGRGLLENEAWAYGPLAEARGEIYFATAKGLCIYRPSFDHRNEVPPILRLRRAEYREEIDGANEIAIEYAALSFANETRRL